MTTNPLRDGIMKLLYDYSDVAPTPWLPDELWDKIMDLIERECQRREREAAEEAIGQMYLIYAVKESGKEVDIDKSADYWLDTKWPPSSPSPEALSS